MKYFFDTEFIEHVGGVDLVSIGIVSEKGDRFYAESSDFDPKLADEWVRENVLKKLYVDPFDQQKRDELAANAGVTGNHDMLYGSNKMIADAILRFVGDDPNPVFYAYYGAYDWVVFARLFGRLIDKPEHFPMFVMDLKQMMEERGLGKQWKQTVCPDPQGDHNALVDALWNRDLHNAIEDWEEKELILKIAKIKSEISDLFAKDNSREWLLNEILEAISHYGYLRYPPRREAEGTFMDRLKLEHSELSVKTNKLNYFVCSDNFLKLSIGNRSLLSKQLNVMFEYCNILEIRLELLESQLKQK